MGVYRSHVLLCTGTNGCTASGAVKLKDILDQKLEERKLTDQVKVVGTGCHGLCELGPLMIVYPEGAFYCKVQESDIEEIVREHLVNGRVVQRLLHRQPTTSGHIPSYADMDFYKKQRRIVLKNCGFINPDLIDEYVARGGYQALSKAATSMTQEEVVNAVKRSGLRGRGGAGFSTGMKWEFTYKAKGETKYIVCNADEGDPGAFMDRSILEGDPHAVLEGMIIAGYAIGATEGYLYVRAEYPLAIKRLKTAISQAEQYGLLGENILNSGYNFHLKIKEGAGAFVCGEETALLASIEGRRGMPRPRPPFPANEGLWGKPTCINNVETFANIATIISKGADWFSRIGTDNSKGTKVFALTGKVANTGLVEVPMGIKMREIIFDIGGGIPNGKKFKAAQIGGPSGGCMPEQLLDLPVDYDSLTQAGAIMGSGGLVVMDEDTCMVDIARFFCSFTQSESCGKCTPCREGTMRMLEILERICNGQGKEGDIELLINLGTVVKSTALCGLGQTAPNPILSTIRYFRDEYEAHIKEKRCPAGSCTAFVKYIIDEERCKGCSLCKPACPVGAISGKGKHPHVIDGVVCTKCGACVSACPFHAIHRG